jgi:hypothetical protein
MTITLAPRKWRYLDSFEEKISVSGELVPTELRPDFFEVIESGCDVTRRRRVTQIRMWNTTARVKSVLR